MNPKTLKLKSMVLMVCAGLSVGALALSNAFAVGIEFLDAHCVTWSMCTQCVEGLGSTIGQSSDTCFAAVGGFGNGTAQHCVTDGTAEGDMCRYTSTADPGNQQCSGAAVYLCDIIDDLECDCECNGSADLSGVILNDTTTCQNL